MRARLKNATGCSKFLSLNNCLSTAPTATKLASVSKTKSFSKFGFRKTGRCSYFCLSALKSFSNSAVHGIRVDLEFLESITDMCEIRHQLPVVGTQAEEICQLSNSCRKLPLLDSVEFSLLKQNARVAHHMTQVVDSLCVERALRRLALEVSFR